MILVTGATGNVGRELVLALTGAGEEARALIRRDTDAPGLPAGAEGFVGDLDRPETLRDALAGVRGVHLMSGYEDMPLGSWPRSAKPAWSSWCCSRAAPFRAAT